MTESLGRAVLALETDARGLQSGLNKAEQQTTGWMGRVSGSFKRLSSSMVGGALLQGVGLGAGITAFNMLGNAVAGAASYMSDAIQDASDLAEAQTKVNVVFGEGSEEIEKWADGAAEAFGQSKQQALEAAGTYGNLFQAFGIGRQQAQEMSTTLVELAADLASFNNTSIEDALLALRSGLSGETEPLKRYGVALNDARIRAELMSQGITNLGATLTAEQKAIGSYALIMEDTALAQGDFARTSDGLANQQRILQARLADVSAEIGEKLMPVALAFVTFVNDQMIPALEGIPEALEGIGDIWQFFSDVDRNARTFRQQLIDQLSGTNTDVHRLAQELGTDYLSAWEMMHEAEETFAIGHEEAIARILAGWRPVTEEAREAAWESAQAWEVYQEAIRGGGPAVDAAARDMADGLPDAMENAEEEAKAIARRTPGSLAGELRASIEDYDKALDELAETAEKSVSDLAERQKIEGILASQELTDALNSDSTRTRLLAMDLVNDLVSDYELIAPGALEAGELVNPSLRDGMESNIELTRTAAEDIRDAASNPLVELGPAAYGWGQALSANFMAGLGSYWQAVRDTAISIGEAAAVPLRLRSPAELGPLSEPADRWGMTLGEMFASGIKRSIVGVKGASLAMAAAAVPELSVPSMAFGGTASAPRGGGNTYHVHLEDRLDVRTVNDIGYGLRRLGDMGVLPGAKD